MDNEITINGIKYIRKLEPGDILIDTEENINLYQENEKIWNKEKPWPQEGDEFFTVYGDGTLDKGKYDSKVSWKRRSKERGNIFQTEEEAQMYSLRIESLSKGFMFKEGNEDMWFFDIILEKPVQYFFPKSFLIPLAFPTKEECQEWYDTYGKAWEYLLTK